MIRCALLSLLLTVGVSRAADPAPAAPAPVSKKPLEVKVEMRDGMRFDPPRFAVLPGQEVIVSLENADTNHLQHNFVVVQPGKLKEIVQQSMELGENGPKQGFIPVNPAIVVHSEVLDPERETKVKFTVPAAKGIYPFVCSMPGHGVMMYGAIYAGEKMPPLNKDPNLPPNIGQHSIPGGGQRPFVQRIFMPDSGPASIAVALPGGENYCWDAGECRLRYAWSGDFLDAGAHWKGSGKEMPVIPGSPWWTAKEGSNLLHAGGSSAPVKFLGYTMKDGLPEFHYRRGDAEVFERVTPDKDGGLAVHLHLAKAADGIRPEEGPDRKIDPPAPHATDFTVHLPKPAHS